MQKGTVVKWFKKEGESIKRNESLVEIEADKVTTEIESPNSGILLKKMVNEETEVLVGEVLAYIGNPDEIIPKDEILSKKVEPQKENKNLIPLRIAESKEKPLKVRASPVARKLAKKHHINLSLVKGSGPKGRITKEDILQFINSHNDKLVVMDVWPLIGIQKTIAERMSQSIKTSAHCSITMEIDASRIMTVHNNSVKLKDGGKSFFSYTAIFVKAVADALKENPILNSKLEDGQIKIFKNVNIGIAVNIAGYKSSGLIVPVIRKANRKSLFEVSEESKILIERARKNKSSHDDLMGGTFTITNLGMYGVKTFVPIINPPEVAILGIGTIIERLVLVREELKVKPLINLTLSFDHRIVNGAQAAKFMQRLKDILEKEISK
jgi:pyruvate dehydrogenase E2 component (dihydrolipoamide acetyltransferase)